MVKPIAKFSSGLLQATVWENKKEDREFKTVIFQKRYQDKEGDWKDSTSLNATDLPRAMVVLGRAYEFLVLKEA